MVKSVLNDLFRYDAEKRLGARGYICGIDEAGRGPLAGSVYAAGVILPENIYIDGLNDSKKLSKKKRESVYEQIILKAIEYHVAAATVDEIEEFNILGATLLAMKRVAEAFEKKPFLFLIDGNKTPNINMPAEAVVKGDGISASIAAASILAKVSRDRYMEELDLIYPQYEFSRHKGYGTKLHYEKLKLHGISPIHRKSFLNKMELYYES